MGLFFFTVASACQEKCANDSISKGHAHEYKLFFLNKIKNLIKNLGSLTNFTVNTIYILRTYGC